MPAPDAAPHSSPDATGTGRAVLRRWRIAVLAAALVLVALWALSVTLRRDARRHWARPLEVAVIVLAPGGVPAEKSEALRGGLDRLESFFHREMARYRAAPPRPVVFTFLGAAGIDAPWPMPPEEGGLVARAKHAFRLRRYLSAADRKAGASVPGFDARLYLLAEPAPAHAAHRVEGIGTAGGDLGLVRAQLDAGTVELALEAMGHELLHCLGATDKYDEEGHAREPRGLVDPGRSPRYPQAAAEIMVGEIPTGPARGRQPDSLDEVAVGPTTALEIGWIPDR